MIEKESNKEQEKKLNERKKVKAKKKRIKRKFKWKFTISKKSERRCKESLKFCKLLDHMIFFYSLKIFYCPRVAKRYALDEIHKCLTKFVSVEVT